MTLLGIINTGVANLLSVHNALRAVGASTHSIETPADLQGLDGIVLPGVGAFPDGMKGLQERNLVEPLKDVAKSGRLPIFGICLGMQLLAESSEEYGHHKGLGILSGNVRHLPQSANMRIPNIGWCDIHVRSSRQTPFTKALGSGCFYFAHSFYFDCSEQGAIAAELDQRSGICVAIEKNNIFGVQFHPEKSQDCGLSVLYSFVEHAHVMAQRKGVS